MRHYKAAYLKIKVQLKLSFFHRIFAGCARHEAKMNKMLVPMFLLLEMIVPVMSRLNSVQVINYVKAMKWKDGPVMCALDTANDTTSSSSLQDCSIKCARDGTCTSFNIKNSLTCHHIRNSLTCDHINTPVLASTSRTHSPVITSIHLYWRQHQELTHL